MKLFIRTEQSVIQDALKMSRPVFVQKYRDTASTEKILEEAYHQLRIHHLKTTGTPIGKNSSVPLHLRAILDPTVGEPDDAVVVTDGSDTDDYRLTKVTIQQSVEQKAITEAKKVEKKTENALKGGTKKERILALLEQGKQPIEIVELLKEQGLEVRLLYVKSLIKK